MIDCIIGMIVKKSNNINNRMRSKVHVKSIYTTKSFQLLKV